MIYNILIGFLSIVLLQTIAKKFNLPTPANGLKMLRDIATSLFEALGTFVGKCLNIYDWVDRLRNLFDNIWRFIREYIWEQIRPFFESIVEIVQPLWQLLFSWAYFFVGFAKTHYVFFSYLGGGLVITGVGYYFGNDMLDLIARFVLWRYLISAVVAAGVGTLVAYPDIFPKLFPNTKKFCLETVDCCEQFMVSAEDREFYVDGTKYTRAKLRKLTKRQLVPLVPSSIPTSHMSKNELILAIANNAVTPK
jgi:hypothetical protein